MNLCLAYPNQFSYSETFVHHHIEELKPLQAIHQGWYPALQADGQSILPFPLSKLPVRGTLRNLVPKIYHRIYTHYLASYFKNNNITVVLAEYGPMGVALLDASQQVNVPLVVHFHGADAYHTPTLERYETSYRMMFQKAGAIIVVSKDMSQQLISLGAPSEKVHYNSCGVDLQQFYRGNPSVAPALFIAVGRFIEKKGPYYTIQAFAKVVEKVPAAKLVMVGEGELLAHCKALAIDLKIASSIEFTGVLSPEKIAELYRRGRAFVQHSQRAANGDSEGTPVAILEASAAGLPVVSTLHAGIKDAVVADETGFLVPEGDVAGMANYMLRLAQNPMLAGEMGEKGRNYIAQHFSMPIQIKRLREIIASVI